MCPNWEVTEQGQKPIPEAKKSPGQMVDLLASDPQDFKDKLLVRDKQFRTQIADLDKIDKEDIGDPGRWSEKDDQ